MIAAIFDLDRTLLPGTSCERLFLRYAWRDGGLSLADLGRGAVNYLWCLPGSQHGRCDRSYLAGKDEAVIQTVARRCAHDAIRPRLSAAGLARIEEHRRQHHHLVLLTGSPDFLPDALAGTIQADRVVPCRLERVEGHFTGRILDPHPSGEGKRQLLTQLAQEASLDLSASFGYADSWEDLPWLAVVGHPTLVNPTWRLRRLARARGWPTVTWR